MSILLWYWGRKGGGARYTLEVARALKGEGVDLHLSISNRNELFDDFVELGLPLFPVDTYDNVWQFVIKSAALPVYARRLRDYIERENISVVYSTMHHLWSAYVSRQVKDLGVNYVLTVHDAQPHPGDGGSLRQWLLDRDIANSDRIIVLTETVKNQLVRRKDWSNKSIEVIPHGSFVYCEGSPRTLHPNESFIVVFYGRILPYKGIKLLVEAWGKIRALVRNVQLEIWGQGDVSDYRPWIESDPSIRLENRWIDESEIADIFKRAHLCVLPYLEASQSGVIPIALAAGVPVVITPQPGLLEQIQHGGGVACREVSADAIADAVIAIYTNPQKYERLSRAALSASEHFGWDRIGPRVRDVLMKTGDSH